MTRRLSVMRQGWEENGWKEGRNPERAGSHSASPLDLRKSRRAVYADEPSWTGRDGHPGGSFVARVGGAERCQGENGAPADVCEWIG